jgi:hypothetical protein
MAWKAVAGDAAGLRGVAVVLGLVLEGIWSSYVGSARWLFRSRLARHRSVALTFSTQGGQAGGGHSRFKPVQ